MINTFIFEDFIIEADNHGYVNCTLISKKAIYKVDKFLNDFTDYRTDCVIRTDRKTETKTVWLSPKAVLVYTKHFSSDLSLFLLGILDKLNKNRKIYKAGRKPSLNMKPIYVGKGIKNHDNRKNR